MWRNHRGIFQDHLKYILYDIVNIFRVIIIHYDEHVQDMHDLVNHLPTHLMKCGGYEAANWKFCDK